MQLQLNVAIDPGVSTQAVARSNVLSPSCHVKRAVSAARPPTSLDVVSRSAKPASLRDSSKMARHA
jgi:hypothetical protein